MAKALVAAEADGHRGHGLSRVAAYAAQARSGKVDGFAKPAAESRAAALVAVDAGNGFAYPAIDVAVAELTTRAPETGVAAATVFRSHHAGQLGAHVERLAEKGLVALMFTNTPKAMAPWGGTEPLLGTNPIAFAAPRRDEPPLVIDLSLSKVARGRVMAAAKAGEGIPEGWALDAGGNPTTDPKAALVGSMLPAGGAKGAALALAVEVLAATLTGANHSRDASSFFDGDGDPPGVGHAVIAIDPQRTAGGGFADRLEGLLAACAAEGGTRLPGTRRLESRRDAHENGLSVPEAVLGEVEALGRRRG